MEKQSIRTLELINSGRVQGELLYIYFSPCIFHFLLSYVTPCACIHELCKYTACILEESMHCWVYEGVCDHKHFE